MSEHETYDEIPDSLRVLLDEIWWPDGAEMWWNSPIRLLDGEIPRDLAKSPEGVTQIDSLLNAIAEGVIM